MVDHHLCFLSREGVGERVFFVLLLSGYRKREIEKTFFQDKNFIP